MSAAQSRARQLLDSAEALFDLGDYDSAVSRAYYAAFHVIRALLQSRGFAPKTHKGLHALVQQHLVPAGALSGAEASVVREAWGLRDLGEYAEEPVAREGDARAVIDGIRRIVAALAEHLDPDA